MQASRRTALFLSLLAAVAGLTVAGCQRPAPEAQAPGPPPVKRLVVAQGTDIRGWDIHNHNHTGTEAVHMNVFDYLVYRNDQGEFEPGLAERWELIDPVTWRFYLRRGVKFHNGDEFTAEDVKWTLERVATDKELVEWGAYRQIKEVVIVDSHTVDIVTHAPQPVLLNRLSRIGSGMLPSRYLQEVGWDGFARQPVGTGPFKVKQWLKDDRLILEAFEDHWRGRPWLDELVFRAIPEDSTRVAELLTGGVDVAVNVPPEDWDRVRRAPGVRLEVAMSNRVMLLEVRQHPEYATSDPRVRAAVEYAIDNQAIVDTLIGGAGVPTRTRVTPGNFGANPALYNTYLYDPERARSLLAEAGFAGGGPSITLQGPRGRYLKDAEVTEMIAGMLEAVGFRVKLELFEWSAYSDMRTANTHGDLHLIGYGNSLFDADLAFNSLQCDQRTAQQRYGYCNPEVSEMIAKAQVEMDRDVRRELYHRIAEIIAEDRPQIFLFQVANAYGIREGVRFSPRLDEMLPMFDVRTGP